MSADYPTTATANAALSSAQSVGIVIVSHSAKLAAGVAELAREMAGPEVALAAVGGLPLPGQPLGTDAEAIKTAIEQVYSPAGVLVLMDLGSALLSAEMAIDALPPEWRRHVALCDAPLVEGAIAASAQARLGSSLAHVMAEARAALKPKVEHLASSQGVARPESGETPVEAASAPEVTNPSREQTLRLTVANRLGLHARPAARLVQTAGRFQADIRLTNLSRLSRPASARSLIEVATLGVQAGQDVLVSATGGDAVEALAAIKALADANFGDALETPPSNPASTTAASMPAGRAPAPDDRRLRGLPASPGVAVGKARRLDSPPPAEPAASVTDPRTEWATLQTALAQARGDLASIRDSLAGRDAAGAAMIDAELLLLDDPALLEPARQLILDEGLDSATAWQRSVDAAVERFRTLSDRYLRERASDVADVGRRVSANLGTSAPSAPVVEEPCILIARDLGPADVAHLDPRIVLGIASELGGPTSHAAILARSIGIPAVVGAGDRLREVVDGTRVLLDGESGDLWIDPDAELEASVAQATAPVRAAAIKAHAARLAPAETRDGRRIAVQANVSSPSEAARAVEAGADGIGLFRSEFLFLDRPSAPGEDEQLAVYLGAAAALQGRPLVIRTLDVGGDKPLRYLDAEFEANPYLGRRGIRLGLAYPDVFTEQLRAIIRAAATAPVKVMFPMIATLEELRRARDLLARAQAEVAASGRATSRPIPVGIMVETPAAALSAEEFAREVDFLSIGTNDLAQYTFAADRGNPRVAALADALHPTVLGLIQRVSTAGRLSGTPVAICGELAADPVGTIVLVGLGVSELSVSTVAIPRVKQAIRETDLESARELAAKALAASSVDEVRSLYAQANHG